MAVTIDSALKTFGITGEYFLAGEWRGADEQIVVENPSTGTPLMSVASASPQDGLEALDAAYDNWRSWAATAPRHRADVLNKAYDLTIAHVDELAVIVAAEGGKTLADAKSEITYGSHFLRWYAEEAVRINGRVTTTPGGKLDVTVRKVPVGPVLAITPWNFPFAMGTRKLAPALAAGCPVILKPAGLTPLTALATARIMEWAGLPKGLFSVLPAKSAAQFSSALLADRRLRKLTFTGSTPVGRDLLREAADNVIRTSMELGGCAPFIVFPDADLDIALAAALTGKTRSNGQACNAPNTFFVHSSMIDEFSTKLATQLAAQKVGDANDPASTVGPTISAGQRAGVAAQVAQAVADGGQVVEPLAGVPDDGYFYAPRVVTNIPASSETLLTEIFGPVALVTAFDDEDEVLVRANATEFGLAGYMYSEDYRRIDRVSRSLEVGMLAVNTGPISNAAAPFGGVKQSGMGREGGPEGLEPFLDDLYIGKPAV
jgi:succinate-semialdehyde dehydrogenase/glutarate-semialdehyde dehydrogenase